MTRRQSFPPCVSPTLCSVVLDSRFGGEDIALVVHTSGSTLVRLKDNWWLETCIQTLA